jgi:protein Mpv17
MFIPALLANWKVWPAVQTINFRFMPLRYRVPFTGAVGIAWQVFLSILNSAKKETNQPVLAAA